MSGLLFGILQQGVKLRNSLYAYFKFDDSSGDAVNSVSSLHGDVTGSIYGGSGVINNCFTFDAATERVTIPSFNLSDTNKLSISLWFRHSSFSGLYIIMEHTSNYNNTSNAFILYSQDGYIVFSVKHTGAGYYLTQTITDFDNNSWHHLVITMDKTLASENTSFYMDNELLEIVHAGNTNNNTDNFINDTLIIGGRNINEYSFVGLLDEIGFWKRILTTDEITELYNSGAGKSYPF